jgi:hypothetical protein
MTESYKAYWTKMGLTGGLAYVVSFVLIAAACYHEVKFFKFLLDDPIEGTVLAIAFHVAMYVAIGLFRPAVQFRQYPFAVVLILLYLFLAGMALTANYGSLGIIEAGRGAEAAAGDDKLNILKSNFATAQASIASLESDNAAKNALLNPANGAGHNNKILKQIAANDSKIEALRAEMATASAAISEYKPVTTTAAALKRLGEDAVDKYLLYLVFALYLIPAVLLFVVRLDPIGGDNSAAVVGVPAAKSPSFLSGVLSRFSPKAQVGGAILPGVLDPQIAERIKQMDGIIERLNRLAETKGGGLNPIDPAGLTGAAIKQIDEDLGELVGEVEREFRIGEQAQASAGTPAPAQARESASAGTPAHARPRSYAHADTRTPAYISENDPRLLSDYVAAAFADHICGQYSRSDFKDGRLNSARKVASYLKIPLPVAQAVQHALDAKGILEIRKDNAYPLVTAEQAAAKIS